MIGVLTVAPWHNSIGDLATADATVTHLVDAGFAARSVTTPEEGQPTHLVIGGGDLLAGAGRWEAIKRRFEVPGRHVLNAVGVNLGSIDRVDWGFTRDYLVVTVRDNETVKALQDRVPKVEAVPCPATLVEPLPWAELQVLPNFSMLKPLEPGGYVVVHRHPRLRRAVRRLEKETGVPAVIVDAQAHHQYPWGRNGIVVPATHSTRVVMTLVQNARLVVGSSLHLCIMSMGAGVPFVAYYRSGYQAEKTRRYLARAGIEEAIVHDRRQILPVAEKVGRVIATVSQSERAAAEAHLATIVASLREAGT